MEESGEGGEGGIQGDNGKKEAERNPEMMRWFKSTFKNLDF